MTVKEFFDVFGKTKIISPCVVYQGLSSKVIENINETFTLDSLPIGTGNFIPLSREGEYFIFMKNNKVYKAFYNLSTIEHDEEIYNSELKNIESIEIKHDCGKSGAGKYYYYNYSIIKFNLK